ncbi:hypothetical protein BSKO_03296 [Bryopsis sp. KO-2023]|nr:hypothetical protein BSKO_03296 [Bryopsis sp. KO-2023]
MNDDCLFSSLGDLKDELGSNYLDLLADDSWAPDGRRACDGFAGVKRPREESCVAEALADGEGDEANCGVSCGVSGEGAQGGASSAKPKGARNKACREKARRERINERFSELAKLCDPEDPKTDKSSILADAIKIMKQLRLENGQLQQLNKFLEERVGHCEKERGQLLYHQSLIMQNSMQAGALASGLPLPGMMPGTSIQTQMPVHMTVPRVHHQPALGISPNSTPTPGADSVQGGTAVGVPIGPERKHSFPLGTVPNVPNSGGWVQQNMLDNSQDHLLRPPAA